MNYFLLNVIFLGALMVPTVMLRKQLPWRLIGKATATLLAITAIFDNLIIGFGIVAYDASKISGLKIGLAPIEDFAYSIAAPILISIVIELTKGRNGNR